MTDTFECDDVRGAAAHGSRVSSGCSYNTFVSKEEGVKAQWAQVENQLQRRNDLIPNLVETMKGIAQQEKDVFGRIADRARSWRARRLQTADDPRRPTSRALRSHGCW